MKAKPFRAPTYQVMSYGKCASCSQYDQDLRYVFNPYGDDLLVCCPCGDAMDDYYNEHAHPDRGSVVETGRSLTDTVKDLSEVLETFHTNLEKRDPESAKRFREHIKGDEDDV